MCSCLTTECKYIKQNLTEFKGEIENLTITVEDFKIPFLRIDKSSRQKSLMYRMPEQHYLTTRSDWIDSIQSD